MFVEYPTEKTHKKPNSNVAANLKLPIFLIPGILGNSQELHALAKEIDRLSESERRIYIYYDPRVMHPQSSHRTLTLEEHAQNIANEMKYTLRDSTANYLVVGYSFGCTLASLAAQCLRREELNPTVYLIDGASPEMTATYFTDNSNHSTRDLANILNYAARLAGLGEVTFADTQLSDFAKLAFTNRFSAIQEFITSKNQDSLKDKKKGGAFKVFLTIAYQNLSNMISHNPNSDIGKIDKLTLLMTSETAQKYYSSSGGWDQFTKNLMSANEPALLDQTHSALVQEDNIPLLAQSIHNFFATAITEEYLLSSDLDQLLKRHANKPYLTSVATEVLQRLSSTSSSDDDHSADSDHDLPRSPIRTSESSTPPSEQVSDDELELKNKKRPRSISTANHALFSPPINIPQSPPPSKEASIANSL